jgi:ankyrin repeat protein
MIFSSIYNLEQDSTPKLLSNQTYLILNILFFVISFVLSDPFYRIYRQDQYIFSLIAKDNPEAIDRYLTSYPQYLNIENNKSSTPLIKALSDKVSSETVLAILKHGPNLKAVRKLDDQNSLMLAIENCQMPVIKKLIELGIDLNIKTPLQTTALFSIHRKDCFEAYPILKNSGVNLKIKNKENLDFIRYGFKYNKRFKDNFSELNELYHFE